MKKLSLSENGNNGESLSFSDPDNVTPAPDWAVGQANREPDFDVWLEVVETRDGLAVRGPEPVNTKRR